MDRPVRGRHGQRSTRLSFGALLDIKIQPPCIAYTLAVHPGRRDTRPTGELGYCSMGEGLTKENIGVRGVLAQWSNTDMRS